MPEESFEARLTAIEAQMAGKTLETHFREQAELIDRLFIYRFEEFDKKWDEKLAAALAGLEEKIDAKLETKLETKLEPVRTDLKRLTDVVLALVARLP